MRRVLLTGLFCAAAAVAMPAQTGDFRWAGAIDQGKTLEIKNVNGAIHAELASGNQVEVVATKKARRSDPAGVRIEVVPEGGSVTICAVYPTPTGWFGSREPNECRPGNAGRLNTDNSDVVVEFVVRLPQGVRLAARTVNGAVDIKPVRSDILARSVNGRIGVATSGAAEATTVNGAIEASVGTVSGGHALTFKTVNGSITVAVPKDASASLHASTVNGRVSSEVPILMRTSSGHHRRVDGTLGSGGGELRLETVNGSIFLRPVTGN